MVVFLFLEFFGLFLVLKRLFIRIKSTFRIGFHSSRRPRLPEMRGPRSQISILCFERCYPACMPAASIPVTGNLSDGRQLCRRMEGRGHFYCGLMLNCSKCGFAFFSSSIHCLLLCPISLTASPSRSITHHNNNFSLKLPLVRS